jgi:penicillin-binding protein 2
MGNRLGIDRLEKYGRMFGLGKRTGIDLPYEADGLVANKEYKKKWFDDGEWYLSETFDAAIGQGFNLVTPLQACMVMSEIAADGKRYKPHLVSALKYPDGTLAESFEPVVLSQLDTTPDIIHLIQQGLRGVTQYGTAASAFRGFPIQIAGKTGTAENSQGRDHGWFVAYGPFDNPNVCVAVIVENGGFGAQSAVPIGRKILEAAFGLNQPQADDTQTKNKAKN